jgi:hypothetical protein
MKHLALSIVAISLVFASCEKENQPAEENESELITTVQLDFVKRGTDDRSTFVWEDADGPGGNLPIIDTVRLDDNSVYDVEISFWNKSVTPAEDITEEVRAESESHRVYFEASAGSGITINGFDNDTGGIPLGIQSVWTTTGSSDGTVMAVLRHYPDGGKAADDPLNSSKSTTDAGAIFNLEIGN